MDFMNMNIDDRFPIESKTADTVTACYINADKDLLKRAVSNLIQNSINHNENGCVIYIIWPVIRIPPNSGTAWGC